MQETTQEFKLRYRERAAANEILQSYVQYDGKATILDADGYDFQPDKFGIFFSFKTSILAFVCLSPANLAYSVLITDPYKKKCLLDNGVYYWVK